MGRPEEKQWTQGEHTMWVKISLSSTAGRTCSEPAAPIVPTRVRAPSPSLLGLFAAKRLSDSLAPGQSTSPTAGTPNPQLRKLRRGGRGTTGPGMHRSHSPRAEKGGTAWPSP